MKKLFIFSVSFFLLVLAFLGVYNFAFKHNTLDPVADPKKKAEAEKKKEMELAEAAANRSVAFQQIIGESVFQPAPGDHGIFYYSKRDKALKDATFDGKEVTIRVPNIPDGVSRVVWSPTKLQALVLSNGLWHLADLRNQTVIPLRSDMSRLAWTTLGDRILYQFTDATTGDRSLNIGAPDGSNWKKLVDLGKEDHFIAAIPQSSLIAFWTKTDANKESTLETISINGDSRRTIITGRFGADFLWSPDNQHILVQSTATPGGNSSALGLTDEDGGGYHNLFAPTFVAKSAWSKDSETIYYSLPSAFPGDAVIPNDYYGKPIYSNDTFWKMNIRTGKKERLVPLDEITEGFDVSDVFLSPVETDLYFTDRKTSKLYRVTL
ncbi:MAG: hypothetical protein ACEQSB_03155 [Undibacterium sp.]